MDPNQNYQNYPNYFQDFPYSDNPAMPYLNSAMGEMKGYYDPYTEYAGRPEDLVDRIMSRFQDSPALQRYRDEQLKAFQNTAASQGRALNPMTARDMGDLASSLYSQQMQDYVNNVLNQQNLGLNAATSASGDIGNLYGTGANLAAQKHLQRENDKRSLLGSLLGGAATLGGAALGGPIAGSLGGAFGTGLNKWMGF